MNRDDKVKISLKIVLVFCITIITIMLYFDFFIDNVSSSIFILFLGGSISLVPLFSLKIFSIKASKWVYIIFQALPDGFAYGLSLSSIVILEKWYLKPDNGFYEPLFIATGLAIAGVWALKKDIEKK